MTAWCSKNIMLFILISVTIENYKKKTQKANYVAYITPKNRTDK